VRKGHLKGQSHEIFDPRFFSLNGTPGFPDSWAKAVLNIDSNRRSNLNLFDAKNRLRVMPLSVKFKSKIFLPTPRYAVQRGVGTPIYAT
jgi:hypothetical protein